LANSSTCMLELAETRVVGGKHEGDGQGGLVLRICRTKGGGCAGGLGFANSSSCMLEFAEPGCTGGLNFANSSTCAFEFAEPRVVGGRGDSVLPI